MSGSSRIRARYYDPDGHRHGGIPTWPWGMAPDQLLTYRQLAARGLRPGGQQPAGQVLWTSRRYAAGPRTRFAYLFDVALAKPKRPMTEAKWAAVQAALAARRICPQCGVDRGYQPSRTLGCCNDCAGPEGAAA